MKYRAHSCLIAAAGFLSLALPCSARQDCTVYVSVNQSLGTLPPYPVGMNTAVWDRHLTDDGVVKALRDIQAVTLRYPGGSTSDVYHWQAHAATQGNGSAFDPATRFDEFIKLCSSAGAAPVITVNYGSNMQGNAGGDPAEAAGWVDYANNQQHYAVKFWEIGNEVYGNGEYGAHWELDLHGDHSPLAYGTNALRFIGAMKQRDPSIKVGVVVAAPGSWPDGQNPDWNRTVLGTVGSNADLAIAHWYPQGPGRESDAGLLSSLTAVPMTALRLRQELNQYCGTNAANVQFWITETNSVSSDPGKQTAGPVEALFAADDCLTWLENGAGNVDWWDLHNGPQTKNNNASNLNGSSGFGDYGALSNGSSPEPAANTPLPAYLGLKMVALMGQAGDSVIPALAMPNIATVHGVRQTNGKVALLFINKDASQTCRAHVMLTDFTPHSSSGTVYTYNADSGKIVQSSRSDLRAEFDISLKPFSMTAIVMGP